MEEMERESREAARLRYRSTDADCRVERMMTEIAVGGTKATSLVVNGPEDAATWDRLAAEVAEIHAKGGVVIYGYRHGED